MSSAPRLFDQIALAARRSRARADALFLHDAAIADIQDRLSMVNRTFTAAAIVTPFPDYWASALPEASVMIDSERLIFDSKPHDLIVHAMSLHWSDDPVGQLIQCRQAMVDDGLFIGMLLGGRTLTELRATLAQAESEITGGLSPRISPMAEIRDLGALLQRAGFALPVADNTALTVEYRDLTHLMHDLRNMGEANALNARLRHATRRDIFSRAQEIYAENFSTEDGKIVATFDLICLTGWAPAASQPKPLRPGSAQARLADALGTRETKLPD